MPPDSRPQLHYLGTTTPSVSTLRSPNQKPSSCAFDHSCRSTLARVSFRETNRAGNSLGSVFTPGSYASSERSTGSGLPSGPRPGSIRNAHRILAIVINKLFSERCIPGQMRRPAPKSKWSRPLASRAAA